MDLTNFYFKGTVTLSREVTLSIFCHPFEKRSTLKEKNEPISSLKRDLL